MDYIRIRGARTHNLKNINLDLPRHRLIVITGLSGSGKSSLAFDTLYAEGQRRYVESLSAYARQFLQLMEKPDVDLIEGLSPAISIEQKATSHNPRSTVGTVTEIHDYLRLLYARVGEPYCPEPSGAEARCDDDLADGRRGADACRRKPKLMILAPAVVNRKGEQVELFVELRAKGFVRVRVDGKVYEIDAVPKLTKNTKHTVEVVVDRSARAPGSQAAARRIVRDRTAQRRRPRDRGRDGHQTSSICIRPSSPARSATIRWQSSSRACSRSTIRWARARAATAWARSASSIPSAWSRFRSFRSPRARSRAGTAATSSTSRCCKASRKHYGFRSRASRSTSCPERVQQMILYGSDKEKIAFTVSVRSRQADGARARVRGHHPEPRAPLSRDRFDHGPRGARQISEFEALSRVRRHAAAARGAARQGRPTGRRARDLRDQQPSAQGSRRVLSQAEARRTAPGDRRQDRQGDRQPAAVPEQRRARLPRRSIARPRRSPAARRSASGSPRRSARD